jgi:hypothetical protein
VLVVFELEIVVPVGMSETLEGGAANSRQPVTSWRLSLV